MGSHVRGAAKRFSEFVTLTTKPIIVLTVKQLEGFLRIEVSLDCWEQTGHVPLMSWKL